MMKKVETYRKLKEVGRTLFEWQLVDTRSGNISVKLNDRILITKSGASLPYLKISDIVEVPEDAEDERKSKSSAASMDLEIHRNIYKMSDFCAIIHSHVPEAISLSFFYDELEPADIEGKYILKKIIFCDADSVSREVAKNGLAVARGHGVYCSAKDLDEALWKTLCLKVSLEVLLHKIILEKDK